MVTHTHTYADLEISPEAYAEIQRALRAAGEGYLEHYTVTDRGGGEGLALQGVRLVPEKRAAEEGGDGGL